MTLDKLPAADRDRLVAAARDVVKSAAGQTVLWYILALTHVYRTSHDGLNALPTAFMEGERNVGLGIIRLLEEVDPTVYPLLLLAEAQLAVRERLAAEGMNGHEAET